MLTCELDENGFEEFGNGKCAFCGREGHDGIIKIGGFFWFVCSLVLLFSLSLFSLSPFFKEKNVTSESKRIWRENTRCICKRWGGSP